mmetsp:Transcript_27040/g.32778  ORF Transcript_27040/g.32778 Transcript_27040/m.32778 type:complete len:121 (+) Transcript_27040:4-366(+)
MRYNEEAAIASRCVTTYSKLAYYTAFTIAYGLVGRLASLVMKNFTGTKDYVCCGAASRGRCGRFIPPLTRLGYRILVCCRISGGGIGHGTRDYIWAEGHWLLHEHRQRHRMLRLGWEAAW